VQGEGGRSDQLKPTRFYRLYSVLGMQLPVIAQMASLTHRPQIGAIAIFRVVVKMCDGENYFPVGVFRFFTV